MEQNIKTIELFNEAKSKLGLEGVSNYLGLHRGTVNRWIKNNRVPKNYFNDLNSLLGNGYSARMDFRDKDQFFTKKIVSKFCFNKLKAVLTNIDIDYKEYNFIEPSVGSCRFYDLLPKDKRIGIDIEPKGNKQLVKMNYLNFIPPKNKKYIVIGNPPFGLRGNLALRFINHSSEFADVVAFILPQLFDSDGKGSTKKRVKGYKLAHTEKLPLNSFEYPDGKEVNVATIFQIWTKKNTEKIKIKKRETCNNFIKVYSLSDGGTPSSTRNKKMLYKCDVYLPSTCFNGMKAYENFEELPHRRGYGVVFLQEKKEFQETFFNKVNWEKVSFLSTNSALNLRKSLIENEIIKRGFVDRNLFNNGEQNE